MTWKITKTSHPPIVTDGLVLNLDAANQSSYPGSGTTWTCLSNSGNNGTLTNGPTYSSAGGGSLSFDGTDDYVVTSSNTDFLFGTGDFALEWWEYFTSGGGDVGHIGVFKFDGVNNYPHLWTAGGGFVTYQGSAWTGMNMSPISNQWAHYVATGASGNIRFYQNGSLQDTKNWDWSATLASGSNFAVGGTPGWGWGQYPMSGKFSVVRVYKGRALSAAEVTQNYNALKGRYQ